MSTPPQRRPDDSTSGEVRRHEALAQLAAMALEVEDPAALTATAASVLVSGCAADHAEVLLLTPSGEALRAPGARGVTESVESGGQAAFVLARDAPVVVEDLYDESRFDPSPALVRAGRRSGIDVALRTGGETLGIVRVYRTEDGPWDEATVAFVASAAELIRAALTRIRDLEALRESGARFAEAQRVAHVGSFEWDLASGTVTWSNELHRIYGLTPGTFPGTLDAFLERVHPEDRERVRTVFERALDERSSFQLQERILRPGGEERILSSRGEVVTDASGEPTHVVGTCQDVTQRERAERRLRRSERRFRMLVESAPDAVLVSDVEGRVQDANLRAVELLSRPVDELYGRQLDELFENVAFLEDDEHGTPAAARVRRPDGADVPVEITTAQLDMDDGLAFVTFVRDTSARAEAETLARHLEEAEQQRLQAFAMNDDVVQGLAAARYALDEDDIAAASRALDVTLAAVRDMIGDLLDAGVDSGSLGPGDLVRSSAPSGAGLYGEPYTALDPGTDADLAELEELLETTPARDLTVVLADDADDVRGLVQALLTRRGYDVVAECQDGRAAIDAVEEHAPDLLVVDLAMPVLDGFEVISHVHDSHPDTRILALSGFDREHMSERAAAAGADAYIEKGAPTAQLLAAVSDLIGSREQPAASTGREGGDVLSSDALAVVVHELRTPLTVIRGMLETLQTRMDQLPSATVMGMLETARRNSDQLERMLDAFADASVIASGQLSVHPERVDVAALVRESVADMATIHRDHDISADAPPRLEVDADPVRLRQVLTNLLSNAAKYSRPGTTIDVDVGTAEDGDTVEIAVTDAGIGIPPGQSDRVFERFERLGRSGRGSGLGLYVSRGIARAHGGDLEIARSNETGSTFVLELPVRAPDPSEPAGLEDRRERSG